MSKIISHLTVNGTPWCEYPLSQSIGHSDITCGHRSLNAAKAACRALQGRGVMGVKVVRGHCPS